MCIGDYLSIVLQSRDLSLTQRERGRGVRNTPFYFRSIFFLFVLVMFFFFGGGGWGAVLY